VAVNIERLVLSRWLRGNKATRAKFAAYGFVSDMFHTYTAHFNFLQDFEEKYGKPPSKAAFKRKFKDFKIVTTKEGMEYYCDQLVERENLIRLKELSKNISPLIDQGDVSKAISELRIGLETTALHTSSKALDWKKKGTLRYKNAVVRRRKQLMSGDVFDTPYPKLNKYIISLRPENLITIAARLGIGKSWLLLKFALHYFWSGAKVLIITKEMSEQEFEDRLDAIDARLNWTDFLSGSLKPVQRKRYKKRLRARKKCSGVIQIVGEESIEAQGLDSLVREIDNFGPDVVLVDGIYHYEVTGVRDEVQRLIKVVRTAKRIAKARKVLFLQTVQLNRQAEGKKKGGGVATLSWSDTVGQESDIVLELIAPEGRDRPFRVLKIIKGRNTQYGEVHINMNMKPVDLGEIGAARGGKKGKMFKMRKIME